MRWYKIEVGDRTFDATNNPSALNVEFDLNVQDADKFISATVVIWGISLQDIGQASDFHNKPITVSGGMQKGLPLATAQAAYAGVLVKGWVYQSFANWVGTEMWLTFIIQPGPPPNTKAAPNAPNPPPRNLVLEWKKGTQLSDAVKQALQTGFPEVTAHVQISSKLVAPQDNIGYYPSLKDLNSYLRGVSQQIMTGDSTYPGVGCCFQNDSSILVHDGTMPGGTKMLKFTDLIGQPTWIAILTIQIKTIMRADIKMQDMITLPPTPVITTAEAQQGINEPLTFQGTFQVASIRHIGNFRQPDGAAWVTVIDALKSN